MVLKSTLTSIVLATVLGTACAQEIPPHRSPTHPFNYQGEIQGKEILFKCGINQGRKSNYEDACILKIGDPNANDERNYEYIDFNHDGKIDMAIANRTLDESQKEYDKYIRLIRETQ